MDPGTRPRRDALLKVASILPTASGSPRARSAGSARRAGRSPARRFRSPGRQTPPASTRRPSSSAQPSSRLDQLPESHQVQRKLWSKREIRGLSVRSARLWVRHRSGVGFERGSLTGCTNGHGNYPLNRGNVVITTTQRNAEEVGFEPTDPCRSHDFQSCRFGRSRTPPKSRSTLSLHLLALSRAVAGFCATRDREPSQGRKAAALSGLAWVPQVTWLLRTPAPAFCWSRAGASRARRPRLRRPPGRRLGLWSTSSPSTGGTARNASRRCAGRTTWSALFGTPSGMITSPMPICSPAPAGRARRRRRGSSPRL